jgi:O-antigen/teichoic acid export membrane protein
LASLTPLLFNGLLNIDPDRIDTAQTIYYFMILSTLFTILSVPYDAVINAHENMLLVAILGVFESLLKLAIAFYVTVYEGDKLIIYGLLMALVTVILLAIKGIYAHRNYDEVTIDLKKHFDKHLFRKMTGFAGYTLLGISAQMVANYGSGIILNIFFGTIVNAAQGIVVQITAQLGAFARTMLTALNPMITKSEGSGNRELMLKASFAGSRISFFLLIFFYIPVFFEMPFIFKAWLNNVPEFTIIFCTIQMIRNLIEQLYITLYASIASVGNIRNFQIVNAILSLLPLPISYLLFDYGYPPQTLYSIFVIYALAQGVMYLYYAKHECGMSLQVYWNDVIIKSCVPLIIILIFVAIPHFMIADDTIRFFSVMAVHLVLFSLTVWFFGLTLDEKYFILHYLQKRQSLEKRG